MITKTIFLASSSELKADREQFEIFINRKNNDWIGRGIFFKIVLWEDFLDALSQTRLQDEYNKAIRECDIFLMLFFPKVGRYTKEEFETAFGQFKTTNKPVIFTYFKDSEISIGRADKNDLISLWDFQQRLSDLGHYCTNYQNIDELKFKFDQQLSKLAASDVFIQKGSLVQEKPSRVVRAGISTEISAGHKSLTIFLDTTDGVEIKVQVPVSDEVIVQDVLNRIYWKLNSLGENIDEYTYGKDWALIDQNGNMVSKEGNLDGRRARKAGMLPGAVFSFVRLPIR